METINYIIEKYKNDGLESDKLNLIKEAYLYAEKKHEGKKRKSGCDFIEHPLEVAKILTDINVDDTTIVAALVHETISESDATKEELEELFGIDVAKIVESLTKINKLKLNDSSESGSIYLRKVLVGLSEDARVLIIKLADRLHNMRTLSYLPEYKQKQKTIETMNVLIPIAHRLGINSIKSELEDLSLKYSKPEVYNSILEKLDGTREELNKVLNDMLESISEILSSHNIKFKIKGRVKSVYSIYTKLCTGRKWNDIYDILAMRAIVENISDCYLAAGLIHSKYRPIPKRFKDYIAMPKANMYQSLHTSVFGDDGHIFEIQLRTKEMDEIAENGIASHWSYKEHTSGNIKNLMDQKLELYKNIIDSHANDESDEAFAKSMEEELLSDLIYVFTPKGDVMELPQASTPIDFAYRIHTNVGEKMVGAIVNENIVPLDYKLQDGDIVKIKTDPNSKPNKNWLNIVKTTQAKNKIKSYFSKIDKEKYIENGKDLLEKEIKKQKLVIKEVLSDNNINKLCKDLKVKDLEEIYLNIGSLRYTATYIINLIYEDKKNVQDILLDKVLNNKIESKNNYKKDIIVDGCDDILVNIADCCHPVKGDDIIGYITKGNGVTVHKKNCANLKGIDTRLISVSWNMDSDNLYTSKLKIYTFDSNNNLLNIVTKASLKSVVISSINEFNSNNKYGYDVIVKVKNKTALEDFKESIQTLPFVSKVEIEE
ncbi:MAG: bifunctional (p)ppGpp synthetase/guanosine-3',5'-bis(diphosphate) 3'-pyrophosphohydrolase [Bacilli bacterium]|nr:bifunctional (p)ppGpp synthetase/guanosine-3',5'-bis(diphosphate) 3'-pyrophosphohydrolase [Bacilli bacterium]